LEHRLSNFLEWGTLPWQYGIVTVTLALALLINFFVFHGLKTVGFFYSLKLNFICYLNIFFTFDYSLWDRERHTFLRAKTNFNFWLNCYKSCSFLPHLAKGHVSFCHHLASVVRRKLSHLNLLLWTKLKQTWLGWSLGGSRSKLCPTDPPSIQDGCCY
jgi:hypothetical protein